MSKDYTTGQVAQICKVSQRTVKHWFDAGRLRGYLAPGNRHRRIPHDELLRFLNEHGMPTHMLERPEGP